MSKRIIRGFTRIGIGVAVLVLIGGVVGTWFYTVDQYKENDWINACFGESGFDPDTDEAFKVDAAGKRVPATVEEACANASGIEVVHHPNLVHDLIRDYSSSVIAATKAAGIGLGITALAAVAALGFFRGLGWVITGFEED